MSNLTFRTSVGVKAIPELCVGNDRAVLAAARVSTQGVESMSALDAAEPDASTGLIRFLMKNRHGTPFEHNSFTFLVEAPIFVFREFHRHRIGWSYNEESGRYKQLAPTFYLPSPNRNLVQVGRPGAYHYDPGTIEQYELTTEAIKLSCADSYGAYQRMLDAGIAREIARSVLPLNIFTSMYATCNVRSLMAFLSLRTNRPEAHFPSKPQREIEMVAELMEQHFAARFPITYDAFCEFGRVAP